MKGFTTLVLVVIAATMVTGQSTQEIRECKAKVGATNADLAQIRSGKPLTTRPAACLQACVQKKIGMMGEDNRMIVSALKEQYEHIKDTNRNTYNLLIKTIDECKALEKDVSDECEAIKNFKTCQKNKNKAGGFP